MTQYYSFIKTWGRVGLIILVYFFVLEQEIVRAQERYIQISGYVNDANSSERVRGAALYDKVTERGTVTNDDGFFSFAALLGDVEIQVSHLGYRDTTWLQHVQQDTLITILLTPQRYELEEISIQSGSEASATSNIISFTPEQIKELPSILGETDVLKALQYMPGIQGGVEGTSGIHVRGGSPDQNLILLDGVPVYNVSHLFGFFSLFNNDALQSVELVKGGFPARYGGRLSSVVNLTMKEGNMKEFVGTGGIGLISSRLTLEGPIIKDKSSFMISGRRTYLDLLFRPFYRALVGDGQLGYFFHDVNAKVNYIFSPKDRVFLSLYAGKDRFFSEDSETFLGSERTETQEVGLQWGNLTSTLRWSKVLGSKTFSKVTLHYGQYKFGTSIFESNESATRIASSSLDFDSSVRSWGGTLHIDHALGLRHNLEGGLSFTGNQYIPEAVQQNQEATEGNQDPINEQERTSALEARSYLEDQFQVNSQLSLRVGIHASLFRVERRSYFKLQPRIALFIGAPSSGKWSLSYALMQQPIHLLANSGFDLPTDLWVPATSRIGPQTGWQSTIGYERDLWQGDYSLVVEAYFKQMDGVIEYVDGASFVESSQDWQSKVERGEGLAYGIEVFLQKHVGKMSGWVSYTLGRTERQFRTISNGEVFPYRYDRRHDFSIVMNRRISERRSISLTWVYFSGIAITLPEGTYRFLFDEEGQSRDQAFYYYPGRNSYRVPAYHRFDLSYKISKQKRWGNAEWVFSLYNVYSRLNPFYTTLSERVEWNPDTQTFTSRPVYKQVGLVPIIPSVSYNFTF